MEKPSEPELQAWVIQSMEARGFVCHNLHEMERVNENGVDIECLKGSDKEVIQAKVRPKNKDIPQLKKFAAAEASKRIYVYWDKPTMGFAAALKQHPVEVLTGQGLHASLVKYTSTGYLTWLLTQSEVLSNIITSILDTYDCQAKSPRKMVGDDFPYLWRLKSSVVQVKANLRTIRDEVEQKLLSQTSHDVSVDLVDETFRRLGTAEPEAKSLKWSIEHCKNEAPHVLNIFLFHIVGLSGGDDLDTAVAKLSRPDRFGPTRDWLLEPISTRGFTSVYTWLFHAIDSVYDKLDLLSIAMDGVFKDAMRQVLRRNVEQSFD